MRVGALSVIQPVEVGSVGYVIRRINVLLKRISAGYTTDENGRAYLAIPTRGHVEPSLETSLAVRSRESISLIALNIRVCIPQACPFGCALAQLCLATSLGREPIAKYVNIKAQNTSNINALLRARKGVSTNHLEPLWERLETWTSVEAFGISALKVVNKET